MRTSLRYLNVTKITSQALHCQQPGIRQYGTLIAASLPQSQNLSRHIRRLNESECIHRQLLRPFSRSATVQKKAAKAARDAIKEQPDDAVIDPFDFSTLEAEMNGALDHLKNGLSKLRAGGRMNHEVLENLKVQPEKSSQSKVKLVDVAQVIPKGRTVHIIVGEKDHLKAVTSAIQGSDLSLTPQPDPTGSNPLLLEIKIPSPTAESRQVAVKEAVKLGDRASLTIRDARGKQHKAHRAMQLNKSARADDVTKAGKQMESLVEKAQQDVKKAIDNAKKVLETV